MNLQLFTIFDSKAEAFLPPFTTANANLAKRICSDCLNDPNHPFAKNPGDYTLYGLGDWDEHKALITPVIPPRHYGRLDLFRDEIHAVIPMKGAA